MTRPPSPPAPWRELFERVFEHRLGRSLLAFLVIISLLPLEVHVEHWLRPIFLAVFGTELAVRWAAWRARDEHLGLWPIAFALADGLALLSFLPLELVVPEQQVHLLGLLRLTRLLMLLRFARELALDIYAIVTRREQLQQFGLVSGAVLVLSFVSAVILSQLSISHDDQRPARFLDRLWWSFRQLESADNLVESVRGNPVLIVLSLTLTLIGVFIISFIIGIGTTVVDQVVRAERRRPLTYRGHTVVTGPVQTSEVLIREFVRIYAKNRQIPSPEKLLTWLKHSNPLQAAKSFPRVALLGRGESPPGYLWEPIMRWVVYREGDPAEAASLERLSARHAKRAILLARDDLVHETDAVTVATLAAFRATNRDAHAFVEVTDSATVPIVAQVGGPGTVALDMPHLLGMFLCQHLVTPGVDRLYRDLLTADGSEIYTHVFIDDDEQAALLSRGSQQVRFEELARLSLLRHGVYLIGVLLGERAHGRGRHNLVPSDSLVPWINPNVVDDDPRLVELGARPGLVPLDKLCGIVGVAESYLPLAAVGSDIARGAQSAGPRTADVEPAALEALRARLHLPPLGPRNVALIGASDALPSLLRELARYVPGVQASLFVSQRGDERLPLGRRIEELGVGFRASDALPGSMGRSFSLERGGQLTIFTHDGPDLAGFSARLLQERAPLEALVFLSEPEGQERDARTAIRILRFVRLLEEGKVPHGETLHVLAEFISTDKGAHIQQHVDVRRCGFQHESDLKLTLVSTETIKNYFMVHSAFVPGVTRVYERLLEEKGQEIIRLQLQSSDQPSETTMSALQRALQPWGAIAFAIELKNREVLLTPSPHRRLDLANVVGIYAIADQPLLAQAMGRSPQRPS